MNFPVRLASLLLFALVQCAAGQCGPLAEAISLRVEGVGTAYFEQFESDTGAGTALLYGGVCLQGSNAQWTVLAQSASLSGLRDGQEVQAIVAEPLLELPGWEARALSLQASAQIIVLTDVLLNGHGLTGRLRRLELPPEGSPLRGWDVHLQGRNYSITASSVLVEEDEAQLEGMTIAACECPVPPLSLRGDHARLGLTEERLTVDGATVELGGLVVPLGDDFEVTASSLAVLALPVGFEYRPGESGLGLTVPNLPLTPGLTLSAGVLGLAGTAPLQGFGLLEYDEGNLSFSVGRARGGPRADLSYRHPLGEVARLDFTIRNRHEPDFHYLHDGGLRLSMVPVIVHVGGGSNLRVSAAGFAAASSQRLASGPVQSARLGVDGGLEASLRLDSAATLTVAADGAYTRYPDAGASQYGVTLSSRLRYEAEPIVADLRHTHRWTDSGSPFSARLDRLSPLHRITLAADASGIVEGLGDAGAELDFSYDLLRLGEETHGGLNRLGLSLGLRRPLLGDWTLALGVGAEFAGMLDPDPAGRRDGYLQLDVLAQERDWELGTRVRYGLRPESEGLSLLEARAAVPLGFEEGLITPYLGVDLAPLVNDGLAPRISGHGLLLTWHSCCGTLTVGYRQDGDEFTTEFGLALEQ